MIKVSELKKYDGIVRVLDDKTMVIIKDNVTTMLVTEFAPRPNTGIQPVGDDVMVEFSDCNGKWEKAEAGRINWAADWSEIEPDLMLVPHWKPCMKWLMEQRIPTETPEEKEALDRISWRVGCNGGAGGDGYYRDESTSAKHDQGKPMYNLLPANAIESLAKVLTFGAKKYAPNSWQGVEDGLERYRAALLRHVFAIQRGELIDEESGLPHSAHIMCCAAFINELEGK